MNKVLGFAPDMDQTTPGVLTDCANLLPCELGMRPALQPVPGGVAALPGVCGAINTLNLGGSRLMFAGTKAGLYQLSGQAWADVSGVGAPFALGSDELWWFTQLGDTTIASCKTVGMRSTNAGAFAAISGAPKAKIVLSLLGFVVAFDTSDATYGDSPDRWWCSAHLDASNWTPNVATLCTTGRIVESGGAITAAMRLGSDIAVYKRRAVYLARYTGPAEVWNFAQIDATVGCVGQNAVCSSGRVQYFVADGDICAFDGTQVQSIAKGFVRDWFRANASPANLYKATAFWDATNQLAFFFFAGADGLPKGLVYDPATQRWGRADYAISTPMQYATPAGTYDGSYGWIASYESGPTISYDSPAWLESQENPGAFDAGGNVVTLTGVPADSSFTTGDFGDENAMTMCDRLTLRMQDEPTSATATGYVKDDAGPRVAAGSSAIRDDGAFDMRQRARWHRFKVDAVGPYTLIDVKPRLKQAGFR